MLENLQLQILGNRNMTLKIMLEKLHTLKKNHVATKKTWDP